MSVVRLYLEGHYEVLGGDDTSSYVSIATCQLEVSACGPLVSIILVIIIRAG